MQRHCPICMKRHKHFPAKCLEEAENLHELYCVKQIDGPLASFITHSGKCLIKVMNEWLKYFFQYQNEKAG